MSLIYVAVCVIKEKQILCSYAEQKYDFDSAINGLFKHIEPDSKGSFEYSDQCMFYTWDENGYTFIAMCGKDYPQETAFVFLGKVKDEFFKSMNSSNMKPKLQSLFQHFNQNKEVPEDGKLRELKEGLLSMKNQVLEANELIDARGQKLNMMLEKSEALKEESQTFYNVAKKVKRNVLWKRLKWIIAGAVVVILIVVALLIRFVGFKDKSDSSGENNTPSNPETPTSIKTGFLGWNIKSNFIPFNKNELQ